MGVGIFTALSTSRNKNTRPSISANAHAPRTRTWAHQRKARGGDRCTCMLVARMTLTVTNGRPRENHRRSVQTQAEHRRGREGLQRRTWLPGVNVRVTIFGGI